MTAVKKYTRLESSGLWKESEKSEFIEVLITFGKTSVILSDYKDNPLTHWSLPALRLISRDNNEAIFSTSFENEERLRISDINMIESLLLFINKEDKKIKHGKTKFYLSSFTLMLFVALIILYFPSKIKNLAITVISQQHEKQLIRPFLEKHIETFGGVCSSIETSKIMDNILNSVENENDFLSVFIVEDQTTNILHLPSGIILISSDFLKGAPDEKRLTAMLKNEMQIAIKRDPLKTLINQQSAYRLTRFILGLESELPVHAINEFLRPPPKEASLENYLDDFSWVALQNACLN